MAISGLGVPHTKPYRLPLCGDSEEGGNVDCHCGTAHPTHCLQRYGRSNRTTSREIVEPQWTRENVIVNRDAELRSGVGIPTGGHDTPHLRRLLHLSPCLPRKGDHGRGSRLAPRGLPPRQLSDLIS